MKKLIHSIGLVIIIFGSSSCAKKEIDITFDDQNKYTIYDYLVANKASFSSFLSIVEKGGIAQILSAYNPYADGYTLFLPDNKAIDEFIQQSGHYTSLDDLLNDKDYVSAFAKYHVIRKAYLTDDFPFGAFSAYTLSWDQLTVSFIAEASVSYYNINNQAPVTHSNIKLANGYIHVVSSALKPLTYTTYQWLKDNGGYSIFIDAIDITGLKATLDVNLKDTAITASAFTLLVEHDSIFNKRKIFNLQDLENLISPDNTDYTNPLNPLYNFVAYHLLVRSNFLNNFEDRATNYATYSDIPIYVNGVGLNIEINKGRENFDTIVYGTDTTIIDFIGVNYDASNVLTQSGVIHFVDQVMTQQLPIRAVQYYEFWEEPFLNQYRDLSGTYIIDDTAALHVIKYSGADLLFVTGETSSTASGDDYLLLDGNFTISYSIPKIVQGLYKVFLRAESSSASNAVVQVYIDGKNVGGLINLTTGGTTWDAFRREGAGGEEAPIGEFNFGKYETHTIVIKSIIPGKFLWDLIKFEPKN